jgi:hypothetical protein
MHSMATNVPKGFRLDAADRKVLEAFGLTMYQVQHFEFSLGAILEEQTVRHDPWSRRERDAAFTRWLKMPAGRVAKELQIPRLVVADLLEIIDWRNHLVHLFLLNYAAHRDRVGDPAVDEAMMRLEQLSRVFDAASPRILQLADAVARADSHVEMMKTWHGESPVLPTDDWHSPPADWERGMEDEE